MSVIDRLLGRATLRARIEELEEENERLRARYEAESDRRATAVTERQRTEERQNRLEDRIAQLEGELERLTDGADGGGGEEQPNARRGERLRGKRLEEVLERLESVRTGPEGALTATVTADEAVPDAVAEALDERARHLPDVAPCLVCVDDASLVSVALSHPLIPAREPTWSDRFELEREWVRPAGRHVLALVRADLFALGVYEGGERVDYRGFESDVKGSHSKGGFSQARFERIRDGQIDDHLERCREAIGEALDDSDGNGDEPLYLVGQREAVDALVEAVEPAAIDAVDATGKPEAALEDAYHSFFAVELIVL